METNSVKIESALISVYDKDGLEVILEKLAEQGVRLFSTGGTYDFIKDKGYKVETVESQTGYPSILGGRVKTLHPKVFGGILAKRDDDHLGQLEKYAIEKVDLVIVDLYPFEDTVAQTNDEAAIIEKIDIGGIALIRGAAKNFNDVVIVSSKNQYTDLENILTENKGVTTLAQRKHLAAKAFMVSSHYDTAIFNYFNREQEIAVLKKSNLDAKSLRYGENPHQSARFYGQFDEVFEKLNGKELSFNNLVDIDAAIGLMNEFQEAKPTFAILKHNNACGVATRNTISEAWDAALAADNISAFGGILIANASIDLETAQKIDKLFYEVLLAPSFEEDALQFLSKKSKRVLLQTKKFQSPSKTVRTLLNGTIEQDADLVLNTDFKTVTKISPSEQQTKDLVFASKCVKHLKSNAIALVKNEQLLSMGCGQTSRIDALKQAVTKAGNFNMDLDGAIMSSDAFFPFPDCVEYAASVGVKAVVQPGGSIKDQLSIDAADENKVIMVMTGERHFKH